MRATFAAVVLLAALAQATSPPCETPTCELRRATSRFQRCYKQALERDSPRVGGKAKLTITIRESGLVEEVTLDFPEASPLFSQCLRDVTRRLHFRREPHRNVVIVNLVFDPG